MGKKTREIFDLNRNFEENIVGKFPITMDQAMEQVMLQLNTIAEQLKTLNAKQGEHDQVLAYLNNKVDQTKQEEKPELVNRGNVLDLFRIPDPIKSIPSFDGNRKQLTAWIKTVEDTLGVFEPLVPDQQFNLYLQAVNNKIEGRAKDVLCLAGNPRTFNEVKQILMEALGDRQELSFYKSQLWSTKQSEGTTIHSYFNKVKEVVQNIKGLSKQNKLYNESWIAINAFIDEDALAAFISGLRKPYFGYAQAAKPKGIEEAYAFLCKFSCNEQISNSSKKPLNQNNQPQKLGNWSQPRNNMVQLKPNQIGTTNEKKQSYSVRDKPIPMEIDLSMRTKNSFNRNNHIINNHELCEDKEQEIDINHTESSFEEQNFQEDQESNLDT